MKIKRVFALLMGLFFLSHLSARPINFPRAVWDSERTFDYWGLETKLADHGIYFLSTYVQDLDWPTYGGFKTTNYPLYLFTYDFELGIDFGKLIDIQSAFFYLSFIVHDGKDPTQNFIKDYQGIDNIEAYSLVQLSELWAQKHFFNDHISLTFGKIDLFATFPYTEFADILLNNSYTQIPTILPYPTYPNTSVGIVLIYTASKYLKLKTSIFDGSMVQGVRTGNKGAKLFFKNLGKHLLLLNEIDTTWYLFVKKYRGKLDLGLWGFNGKIASYNGGFMGKSLGLYASLTQLLWRQNEKKKYGDRPFKKALLGAFSQWGYCNSQISGAVQYVSGGLTYYECIKGFYKDALSIGAATVFFSKSQEAPFSQSYESSLEITYQFFPLPELLIQPDLQWVLQPGGEGRKNALVASLRLVFSI